MTEPARGEGKLDSMAALVSGLLVGGKYRVLRPLGTGGMGAVYEVENAVLGGRAALKVLTLSIEEHPELFTRFQNEARAANQTGHPGVVPVYDFGQLPDGTPWLVMPLLVGESLAHRLRQAPAGSHMALGLAGLWVIGDIASALGAAHAHGIIHRDLKPANVMLVADPSTMSGERAMVLDFGVAKLRSDELTKRGAMLGTPVYMALEQFRDSATVDGKADVFSLGCIAYQLLSGELPHHGTTHYELMGKRLMEPVLPLSQHVPTLPGPVVALVMAMLDKEPSARPDMLQVESVVRRALGLPPPRQTSYQGGATGQGGPPPHTEVMSPSSLQAMAQAQAAVGTPSEQRMVGELSPLGVSRVPSEVIAAGAPLPVGQVAAPTVVSGPEDRTAQPAPTPLLPQAVASPSLPTAKGPTQQRPWPKRLGTVLLSLTLLCAGFFTVERFRASRLKRPQAPPAIPVPPPAPVSTTVSAPVTAPVPVPATTTGAVTAPVVVPAANEVLPSAPTTAPPTGVTALPTPGQRPTRIAKPAARACEAQEVTESCIVTSTLTMQQRSKIVSAMHHGSIKLCPQDRLVLTGIPSHPRIKLAPAYLRRDQSVLLYGLRALPAEYPAEVELRCRPR